MTVVLLLFAIIWLFIFIEGDAMSMINLNYIAHVCKIFIKILPKMVRQSAATSNSTHTTK